MLDLRSGRLTYGYGGHNLRPLLLCQNGGTRYLEGDTGAALGIIDEYHYNEDTLLLYTDGVSEAMNRAEDWYGEARLQELTAQNSGSDVQKLIEQVLTAVREFTQGAEQSDDITMLAMRYAG